MADTVRAWGAEESLADLTLYADWDPVTSMILSLRLYLFEHGSVPIWNFMLCGGRPELSVPFSWAYTWPSVFAYTLSPNHAVIAVWTAMTLVGFFSVRALLERWSGSRPGAWVGAGLYVLCGCFAARFNAGHVTFAFYHLVPLLMVVFEWSMDRAVAGLRVLRPALAATMVSFLFATAGLPHPLIHFYPAFLLLVAVRVVQCARRHGAVESLRAASIPVVSNALGFWLAAYKLWPVIRWQMTFPRKGVGFESYGVLEVIQGSLIDVDYLGGGDVPRWYGYPPWEYNAFVGTVPWLLAAVVVLSTLVSLLRRRGRFADDAPARPDYPTVFACLLIALGIALTLGNDNPMSPSYWFRHLPVLHGVRVFVRYQILIVFGLAILVAQGVAVLSTPLRVGAVRRLVVAAIALGTLAPVAVQAGRFLWNVEAEPNAALASAYEIPIAVGAPRQLWVTRARVDRAGHQTSMLERGDWIGNCYSNLTLPGPEKHFLPGRVLPLSSPPPRRLVGLGSDSILLDYPEGRPGRVEVNLRVLPDFDFDVPVERRGQQVSFRADALEDHRLKLTAKLRGPTEGALASAAGLVTTALFFAGLARRERRRDDGA